MARAMRKRVQHKDDMKKLDRTALIIGGIVAAVILLLMIGSLLM